MPPADYPHFRDQILAELTAALLTANRLKVTSQQQVRDASACVDALQHVWDLVQPQPTRKP